MKPGDRVWMFFPLWDCSIRECEVVDWPEDDATFSYKIVGLDRERPYVALKADAFQTRVALCEHYRKIFE